MTLGEKLRKTREEMIGVNGVEMARRLGLNTTVLSFIETGRRRANKKHLEPIAREYGLPLEEVKALWVADTFSEENDGESEDELSSPSNLFPLLEIIVRRQINPIMRSDLDALIRTQALFQKPMSEEFIIFFLEHRKE